MNLVELFKSFSPLLIAGAGLVDGINPCAFTVVVFFLSFLSLQGYGKIELLVIGLAFIFTIFFTYVLIGLGIFSFLYRLEGFHRVSQIVNFSVALLSFILGILCLWDYFKIKITRNTDGVILKLPAAIKFQIQRIIGLEYRGHRTIKIFALVLGTIVTGFLVTILEAVCTGQVYLPTITLVLKLTPLKLHALSYLLLYNLMFITPLMIIFFLALLGVSSPQFAKIFRQHLSFIKLIMAVFFFALGIFLFFSLQRFKPLPKHAAAVEKGTAIDAYIWDFGQAKEGEILKHEFVLKNNSQKTLAIKDVSTSCGCAVSQVEKKILTPGEETLIDVQFNTKGYFGLVQQFIYVNTDDIDNPLTRFIVKTEVLKK